MFVEIAGIRAELRSPGLPPHTTTTHASRTMLKEEFDKRVSVILMTLRTREYLETLRAIDELESDARDSFDSHAAAVCCADLRLDAALATHQAFAECEARYNNLVSLGL